MFDWLKRDRATCSASELVETKRAHEAALDEHQRLWDQFQVAADRVKKTQEAYTQARQRVIADAEAWALNQGAHQ